MSRTPRPENARTVECRLHFVVRPHVDVACDADGPGDLALRPQRRRENHNTPSQSFPDIPQASPVSLSRHGDRLQATHPAIERRPSLCAPAPQSRRHRRNPNPLPVLSRPPRTRASSQPCPPDPQWLACTQQWQLCHREAESAVDSMDPETPRFGPSVCILEDRYRRHQPRVEKSPIEIASFISSR